MFRFLFLMLIPLGIFIYTLSFGRWLGRREILSGSIAAYLLAVLTFGLAGYVLWTYAT